MFQNETLSPPLSLSSTLFLLPFLLAFEWGAVVYSSNEFLPAVPSFFVPGMFSVLFFSVLYLQKICYKQSKSITVNPSVAKQWKESCWFGLMPALLILTSYTMIANKAAITDTAVVSPAYNINRHTINNLPRLSTLENFAEAEPDTIKESESSSDLLAGRFVFVAIRAGLLEEFFFRVVLLSGLFGLLLGLKLTRKTSLIFSVIISSIVFAFAHETTFSATFSGLFLYRLSAGVYLSMIYLHRGLGIATGTHIVYDLTISCWN